MDVVARRRWVFVGAMTVGAACAIGVACGTGDISDLTAGRPDGGAGGADADAQVDAEVCIHALPPERPSIDDVSGPSVLLAMEDIRYETGPIDGGGPPRPESFDLDRTCTCPEPESCLPPDASMPRKCDGDGGRDNVAGELLAVASSAGTGFGPQVIRSQVRAGLFGLLISIQGWNGQPDDPSVIVGIEISNGTEGIQSDAAPRALPKFDGNDVYTLAPSSVLGGGDVIGRDCRKILCVPNKADTNAYVRGGVVVAHLDIPLSVKTSTGTFEIDFIGATVVAKLTKVGGVLRATGELAGRWPVERLLRGFARVRNPQSGLPLCASDAGLQIYGLLKQSVCDSADLALTASLDKTGARCEALSNAVSFTAVNVIGGTLYEGDRVEPGDCPGFTDRCQN